MSTLTIGTTIGNGRLLDAIGRRAPESEALRKHAKNDRGAARPIRLGRATSFSPTSDGRLAQDRRRRLLYGHTPSPDGPDKRGKENVWRKGERAELRNQLTEPTWALSRSCGRQRISCANVWAARSPTPAASFGLTVGDYRGIREHEFEKPKGHYPGRRHLLLWWLAI